MAADPKQAHQDSRAIMEKRVVRIPACVEHNGMYAMTLILPWYCLVCGEPRGEPFETLSYDGSRRLNVHGWRNVCGHIESYADVRAALPHDEVVS